ncbi:hypothetical protein HN789_05895 [archaeon]|jgi:hypothetical protein|nr:hypothetical protein [archaeon]MBT4022306.1 hypothetical protein [archaeon]MBT4271737.1 hypothetical protein [archaeon]MBT4461381.1 hypothetical protein [archaeon]MBT4858636.1 hypothetical protein [archaeon]
MLNIMIIIAGFILVGVLYFNLRDSPRNNFRRARKHHKLGDKEHSRGDHSEAKLHYEIAKQYREKAMEQMGE